jgi:hypothetical protein
MSIDEAKRFLELLSQKTQSGGFTPTQFNLAVQRAQMQLYERDYKVWQQTEEVTEAMSYFITSNAPFVVPTTGKLSYPAGYLHTVDVRRYYVPSSGNGVQIQCKEVKAADVGEIQISRLTPATLRFPKFVEYDLFWQFYPKNVGNVIIDYFRQPTNPVWGFTIVNGRDVYNPATSTQFEFPDFSHNEIMGVACGYLGINIRDAELLQFAQMFKQENA